LRKIKVRQAQIGKQEKEEEEEEDHEEEEGQEREEREQNSENSDDQGDQRRDEREEEEQNRDELDMSAFSYDSAVKLPELKTLGSEETRDFLNAVEGYHSILNADGKRTLIGFVYRTKITGKAKTRLGEQEVETLEELRAEVQGLSSETESVESLMKKLKNCRQAKRTPEEFAIEISALTDKLANIEIGKTANATNAVKLAVRNIYKNMGLSAFNRGVESSVQIASGRNRLSS
jgi:hypothetical protein